MDKLIFVVVLADLVLNILFFNKYVL